MIRRPPRSTLFPTRRSSDLCRFQGPNGLVQLTTSWHSAPRSEEHTSELQSPCNLVCRLLLEKKITRCIGLCLTLLAWSASHRTIYRPLDTIESSCVHVATFG